MINNLIKLAKEKNIEIEIYTRKDKHYSIEVLNDSLTNFDIAKSTNYHIKAIYNEKMITLDYESLDNSEEIIKNLYINKLEDY